MKGRPREHDEPLVNTAFRIPESLHERLKDAATERDVSMNRLVESAIRRHLDNLPPLP